MLSERKYTPKKADYLDKRFHAKKYGKTAPGVTILGMRVRVLLTTKSSCDCHRSQKISCVCIYI